MGRYHPHGNLAIYDALVRLAQDFSLNAPLIDGHGNFGSPDDGPAAERYTGSRVSREAMLLVGAVGEGNLAIYDALVRLAQDFSLNAPLIDGHGNFGSPDDGPAAE